MEIFVRNSAKNFGHVPDNEIWYPEYDQNFGTIPDIGTIPDKI